MCFIQLCSTVCEVSSHWLPSWLSKLLDSGHLVETCATLTILWIVMAADRRCVEEYSILVTTPCQLVICYVCFGWTHCYHLMVIKEEWSSSKTSVANYQSTWRHIPENYSTYQHCGEVLSSHKCCVANDDERHCGSHKQQWTQWVKPFMHLVHTYW